MTNSGTGNRARLYWEFSQKAIGQALEGQWREALETNEYLLTQFPDDTDTYNRIGKSHLELREYEEARDAFQKTSELAPTNMIARRNLGKLERLLEAPKDEGPTPSEETTAPTPELFVEETGKASITALVSPGEEAIIQRLAGGDAVNLDVEGNGLVVRDRHGEYIGEVDAKLAMRVIRLIHGGNRYAAAVVTIANGEVRVMLKETYQDPEQVGRVSFPSHRTEGFRAYTKGSLIHQYGVSELRAALGEDDDEVVDDDEREGMSTVSSDDEESDGARADKDISSDGDDEDDDDE